MKSTQTEKKCDMKRMRNNKLLLDEIMRVIMRGSDLEPVFVEFDPPAIDPLQASRELVHPVRGHAVQEILVDNEGVRRSTSDIVHVQSLDDLALRVGVKLDDVDGGSVGGVDKEVSISRCA